MNTTIPSIIEFSEVNGQPKVRMELPALLRIGERIKLKILLRRQNGTRLEELKIDGEWKVTFVMLDVSQVGSSKQVLKVDSCSATKTAWKSIRKESTFTKKLSPAKHPKTIVM